jgi:hypothetical protein
MALNGGIRPLNSRFSSSSDESSNSEGEEEEEVMSLLQIERPIEDAEEEVEEGFSPDDTVFASRIDTCDSESFYDDVVLTDMLEMDWERAIQDQPKVKMSLLKKHKGGLLCDAIPENIDEFYHELLDVFRKFRAHIYNSFDFYAVMGNGTDTGQIQMNQYSDWLDDCNITEANNVPQCNRGALDRIFIVVNREDDQEEGTADANDDRALMRFEFLEIILRIAAAKYIDTRKSQDLIASTRKLLTEHILPNRGEGSCNALIDDPTQFRKLYVYTEAVDKELRKHLALFQQMYGAYCRNGAVGMNIREWLAMLKDLEFLNYDFTNREAKLAFVWAKSRVIDEVKSREKIHRMTFYDFMEGLLRVAQLKPLPVVPADLDRLVVTKALKEPTLRHWLTLSVSKKAKKALKVVERRSSEWGAPQTRKHHIKLRILVRLIKVSCDPRTGRSELFQLEGGDEAIKKK